MGTTGLAAFDATIQETNELLNEIEEAFGWQDRRQQSYAAVRSVLHTLRDRLPVNSSVHFASQLPLLLKGVYYDGWKPTDVPKKMDRQEFIQNIRKGFVYDLEKGTDIEDIISSTLDILMSKMPKGQREEIEQVLPEELDTIIES